ncbi:DUF4956 domain-containing protein [Candidatus Peregrinibacteria bacterium]|nr:DUF4956 domain-containing protein [Candidatus Peregrinibacteria bacterium]
MNIFLIDSFIAFLLPFGITLFFSSLAATCFYKFSHKKDLASAIILYSLMVFLIVYFVSFENNLGLGVGLLGILSLIRLRTTLENLTDISFAFYAITLGLLNASIQNNYIMISVDGILTFIIILLSSQLIFRRKIVTTRVIFDDLNFEKLNDKKSLMKRVEKDLKIKPLNVSIGKIDYLKDSVTLTITYEMH